MSSTWGTTVFSRCCAYGIGVSRPARRRGGASRSSKASSATIAAIVAEEAFDDLDAPPRRLAGLETPIPYAQHLEKTVVPQVEDIVRVAKELVA